MLRIDSEDTHLTHAVVRMQSSAHPTDDQGVDHCNIDAPRLSVKDLGQVRLLTNAPAAWIEALVHERGHFAFQRREDRLPITRRQSQQSGPVLTLVGADLGHEAAWIGEIAATCSATRSSASSNS